MKKKWGMVLFLGSLLLGAETFIEESAPKSRTSLPKARRQALESLEDIAHELTRSMALSAQIMDDILYAGRALSEGDKKNELMRVVSDDRSKTLVDLEKHVCCVREATKQLQNLQDLVAHGCVPKK